MRPTLYQHTSARTNYSSFYGIVVFRKVTKGAHSSPSFFFFSELDCAIASTMGRTKNFALKNQIYCEFSGSVACQVLIKQRALEKKRVRNLLSSEFFATFKKKKHNNQYYR